MKIKIEVTEGDIKKGKIGDSLRCPIAMAIKRAIEGIKPKIFMRGVGCGTIDLHNNIFCEVLRYPMAVTSFISKFDEIDMNAYRAIAKKHPLVSDRKLTDIKRKAMEAVEQHRLRAKLKPFSFSLNLPKKWFEEKKK